MGKFKIGQRVKKAAHRAPEDYVGRNIVRITPIGTEGVVTNNTSRAGECAVQWDDFNRPIWSMNYMLAPLTHPTPDTWALDAVRKVTRVHVEPTVRETESQCRGDV